MFVSFSVFALGNGTSNQASLTKASNIHKEEDVKRLYNKRVIDRCMGTKGNDIQYTKCIERYQKK
jgi:hypothetical protein